MWDGTGDQGQAVGSGVYHAMVRSGKSTRVVKMLLLR
jgi:hypothetical protein